MKFATIKEAMSQDEVSEYFGDWDPLERDWKTAPNPDDYDSVLYEEARKWAMSEIPLWDSAKAEKVARAICNAYWNGNSQGFRNANH